MDTLYEPELREEAVQYVMEVAVVPDEVTGQRKHVYAFAGAVAHVTITTEEAWEACSSSSSKQSVVASSQTCVLHANAQWK